MSIVVQKYGGSSVKSIEKIRKVAQTVIQRKCSGDDVIVVVSAMGDTTDHLNELANCLQQKKRNFQWNEYIFMGIIKQMKNFRWA